VSELDRDPSRDSELGLTPLLELVQNLPLPLREVSDYIRTLAVRPPKVVHLWLDDANIKGGVAAVALGIPRIVLGMRSLPPCNFPLHQPYMREGYRWLAEQPSVALLNNSAAGARAYEKWLGLSEGTIRVVRNGFDFDLINLQRYVVDRGGYRACHNIPITAPVLGTVMRLSEEKRPLLWLEIAAEIRRQLPDARFLIVGDGLLRSDMEARAACNDLREAVYFTGRVSDTFAAIAAMDIFLLISRAEGLPNVLVEAQALGIPVVTTNVGGAPETVKHGSSGWILERDNVEYVADVVVRLLRDQPWRSKVRAEAPKFVRASFGMERMLDETLAAYRTDINDFMVSEAAGITQ
jgi:glycosyltransferase involved in cell wall biosynthesis